MFLDRRALESSEELRGAPGSSRELGSGHLALLTLLEGRQAAATQHAPESGGGREHFRWAAIVERPSEVPDCRLGGARKKR
eukprot:5918855-Alexandrium_andersonii.AAC.1